MRKARRQDTSASAPPTISPAIEPTPVMAPNTATAAVRSGPLGKVVAIRASAVGEATAAPTPWMRRKIARPMSSCARPTPMEARVNNVMPPIKTRLRPKVSPRRPPSSISPPKDNMYAVITQLRVASLRCSSA
ncbi:Uncharacterised protein [Mycobacteroides abscessus]|nr:Uncharacterised protein [Mycobacteroides abscessus]SKD86116.1 Uncharacterised protein [Mycobacteroides abscessus subsp. massiliense]CPV43592.1 Uncharacterised protein [Mycobacteroides abscessus]CPV75198.1 Uncharacterised protein [Mycobacteroides abscessus]SKL29492.1 Uncharacterised protein [Mycobacteroides abscessus subsp. massiliense]